MKNCEHCHKPCKRRTEIYSTIPTYGGKLVCDECFDKCLEEIIIEYENQKSEIYHRYLNSTLSN